MKSIKLRGDELHKFNLAPFEVITLDLVVSR